MKTIIPSCYRKFRCIASCCRHNCCREGWEIFLDDRHVDLYRKLAAEEESRGENMILSGLFLPGAKERRNGARPKIRLGEDGVCPFLNEDGLCRLILNYGEKSICQICTDHPRFRNYYRDRCETGLGLCCEEACRLILTDEETGKYVNSVTGTMEVPLHQKLDLIKKMKLLESRVLDFDAWAEYLLGLEQLESRWGELLRKFIRMNGCSIPGTEHGETEKNLFIRNLQEYFLYRYGCTEIGFASFSLRFLVRMAETFRCFTDSPGEEDCAELCRLYSTEIEYSEENRILVSAKLRQEGYQT